MRKLFSLLMVLFLSSSLLQAQVTSDSAALRQVNSPELNTQSSNNNAPAGISAESPVGDQSNSSKAGDNAALNAPPDRSKKSVYHIRPWVDIPLAVATDAYSLYGMSVIYGRDETNEGEILALRRDKVNKFDRPITYNYSESAKSASDLFFYGSMPLPLLLMIDKQIRRDGLRVGLLYLESMGITGTLYTTSARLASRFRPYAYNEKVEIGTRRRGGAKNSFYAGHPSVVATSTFFMAKVWSDYHPDMKGKWILYTVAAGATAATGFLRLAAGQHFRTDVMIGCTVGAAVGVLVPHFHKNRTGLTKNLSLFPNINSGSHGFTAFYRL